MLWSCFSRANLAEWTPITTNWLGQASSNLRSSGMMCMQLMQPRVQKSSKTNLPRNSLSSIGRGVLNQCSPTGKGRAISRCANGDDEDSPADAFRTGTNQPTTIARATNTINRQHHFRSDRIGNSFDPGPGCALGQLLRRRALQSNPTGCGWGVLRCRVAGGLARHEIRPTRRSSPPATPRCKPLYGPKVPVHRFSHPPKCTRR